MKILYTTRIQKKFPLSVFIFIDFSSCLFFTRRGWLCDFPPKKTRVAFGLPYCWLSYFTLVCLWCGRTVGRVYGHVITNFLGWVDYQIFLPMVLRFARVELHYKCNHCSKTFKLRSSRFIHTRKYPGQGNIFNLVPRALFPGPGDEVATSFVAKSVLSLHPENRLRINTILKHVIEKLFKCDRYSMAYKQKARLDLHKRTHT